MSSILFPVLQLAQARPADDPNLEVTHRTRHIAFVALLASPVLWGAKNLVGTRRPN